MSQGHRDRVDQVFCHQWSSIFTNSTKKKFSDMSQKRGSREAPGSKQESGLVLWRERSMDPCIHFTVDLVKMQMSGLTLDL